MTTKTKILYKAWSRLLGDWVFVYAHSPIQAKELIKARVLKKVGMTDEFYKVIKEEK